MSTVHLYGVPKDTSDTEIVHRAKQLVVKAFGLDDLVKPGKTVALIKVPLNGKDKFPAVGDWRMIKALGNAIEERGGKVIVGDQSGIEYEKYGTAETSYTEYCYAHSGMVSCGYPIRAFEKEGYHLCTDPKAEHWPNGFHITNVVNEVTDIFVLARVAAHGMFGITGCAKGFGVGILEIEDRLRFHAKSPMDWYIKLVEFGKGRHQPPTSRDRSGFQMVAELTLPCLPLLRGCMFSGIKVLADKGPNGYLMELMGIPLFRSDVYEPEVGLLGATTSMPAADAVLVTLLGMYYEQVPAFQKLLQRLLVAVNGSIKEPNAVVDPYSDPVIAHQLKLGIGEKVSRLDVLEQSVPEDILSILRKRLSVRHGSH